MSRELGPKIAFLMCCNCSVALPHGVVGWSAVCDCVFPAHTHLLTYFFCSSKVDQSNNNCKFYFIKS